MSFMTALVYALVVGADEVARREGRLIDLRRSCVTGREFMRLQHQLKELLIWLNYTLPGSMLLSACVHDLKYYSFPIIFLLVGKKRGPQLPIFSCERKLLYSGLLFTQALEH